MSHIKKKATKKPSKRPHTSSDLFRNDNADMAFNDHYKRALIILERTMDLRVPRGHFHSGSVQRKNMDDVVESNGQCI